MFPKELTDLDNWCVWKYVQTKELDQHGNYKMTKVPIDPETGELAKSNNRDTWSPFEIATTTMNETNADGLGFFFEPPYIGIDLDNIAGDVERYQAGNYEDNIVFEFHEMLKSYTEISPSGEGLHIIVKGEIPGDRRRNGDVEMYTEGRFFTMTGNSFNKYTEVNHPQNRAIEILYKKYIETKPKVERVDFGNHGITHTLSDSEVISRAIESKNGSKFKDFLEGNWERHTEYPSQSEADIAFSNILAFWTARNFQQMDRIFRKSGMMRDKFDERRGKTTIGEALLNKAINETADVYTPSRKKEPLKYTFGAEFYNDDKKSEHPTRSYDDTGNAMRFLDRYGDITRYSYNRGKFYVYNGSFWEIDERGLVRTLIDQTVEDMKNEKVYVPEDVEEDEAQKAFKKHVSNSRSNAAKNRMEDEIKHHIPVDFVDFNPNDLLLNTQNGYIDLSGGTQHKEDKDKMFSYVTNTEMTENQRPDVWIDFLNDIFNYDQEMIDFIQKSVGYSMTGSTREQVMFILHGKGRNGKSIFIETIRDVLGTYADNIQAKTLMVRQGDTINNDIAKLQGRRLVTSSEPNEGFRFDEGLIKQLTGGDTVTARFLYGEEFNFQPKFKIWVTTNHKPLVRGTDDGIWRRLLLIPFKVQIPEHKVDKDLKYKLMREAPAILNWAVEGSVMWQRDGLQIPEEVLKASKSYRQEMDVIEQFIEEECQVGEDYEVSGKELYDTYKDWADDGGEYKMNKNKFGKKVKEKFKSKRSNGTKYIGIKIKEDFPGMGNFASLH